MDVKYLGFSCNNGEINMRLDEDMLKEAVLGGYDFALLRFYTWEPRCVSLGRAQKNVDFSELGVDVVRRTTGGRALLHDKELTYSIVAPILKGESVLDSYRHVSDGLIAGFQKLGIELKYSDSKGGSAAYCMEISCGADISYKGKKLVGSAQFRVRSEHGAKKNFSHLEQTANTNGEAIKSQGYFLQHGSILLDADFDLIEKIFLKKVDKNSLTTLGEIDATITLEELTKALRLGLEEHFKHKYHL